MTWADVSSKTKSHIIYFILLPVGKFNQGVSAETKKQTWAEITNQINGLGENHREVCYCDHLILLIMIVWIYRPNDFLIDYESLMYTVRHDLLLVIDGKSPFFFHFWSNCTSLVLAFCIDCTGGSQTFNLQLHKTELCLLGSFHNLHLSEGCHQFSQRLTLK